MFRFNGYDIYQLANAIHPLTALDEKASLRSQFAMLLAARNVLEIVLTPGKFVPDLAFSRPHGFSLFNAVIAIGRLPEGKTYEEIAEEPIDQEKRTAVIQAAQAYENVLAADLRAQNFYMVPDRGAYSSRVLIENGERLIPENVRDYLPAEAIIDLKEAGKSLALEVSTAAGFHLLRATEATIRQYLSLLTCAPPPSGKLRNWGVYVRLLRKAGADPKVVSAIDQTRELHRNPVMHPETVLSTNDALVIAGLATSILLGIAGDVARRAGRPL